MNPLASHYIAQMRMEELRREAERYRLVSQIRPTVSAMTKIRAVAGGWLVSAGERVLPCPTTQKPVSQR
jgi:hypothetical protein